MSEAAGHGHGHGDDEMGHAVGWPILVGVFLTLMGLTFLTVAVTYVDLGPLNIVIALGVATIKAALVVLFFMHLFWDKALNTIVFGLTIAFVGVFLAFTIIDTKQYQGSIAQRNADLAYGSGEGGGGGSGGAAGGPWTMPKLEPEEEELFKKFKAIADSGSGDAAAGKPLFTALCATCHKLGGEGAEIGPDLTTFDRGNLDHLLFTIVLPSKEIKEGYENYNVRTKEQGVLIGVLKNNPDGTITVKTSDGKTFTLKKEDLKAEPKKLTVSLMPDGILEGKSEDDIRNLLEYIKSVPAAK